jgi:hypothetical protein
LKQKSEMLTEEKNLMERETTKQTEIGVAGDLMKEANEKLKSCFAKKRP